MNAAAQLFQLFLRKCAAAKLSKLFQLFLKKCAGWRPLTVLSDIIKASMNERGIRTTRVPLFGLL